MIVILVVDRELVQLLPAKFTSTMRTNPWKHFERLLSIGLLSLSLGVPCHVNLGVEGDLLLINPKTSLCRILKLVCFVYLVHLVCLV